VYFKGGQPVDREVPEDDRYIEWRDNVVPGSWSPFYKKPRNLYNTGQAVCGARGCTRACMIQLEKRGVLRNQFKDEFRRRKPWSVDWSTEPVYPEGTEFREQVKNEAD
jgi:hypothetical protein